MRPQCVALNGQDDTADQGLRAAVSLFISNIYNAWQSAVADGNNHITILVTPEGPIHVSS